MSSAQVTALVRSDVEYCRAILTAGSKSFDAASRILPARIRDPASVFYAFCRVADDAVDESPDPSAALEGLRGRLARIYEKHPDPNPVDRALARVVESFDLPRPLLDALLEGFAWDAEGRTYESLADVLAYSARVASTVGVVMTLLMGVRDANAVARACDMGAAMQLTNIARDVGEDAARGRLYLPRAWLREEGLDPAAFLQTPRFGAAIGRVVARLIDQARQLYERADSGVLLLPPDCRSSIRAARLIYADIGRVIARASYDSLTRRAQVSRWRKLWLVFRAHWPSRARTNPLASPCPEFLFLVKAVTVGAP